MGAGLVAGALGIQGPPGMRAVSMVGPNQRASTTLGAIGTVADVVMFSNPVSVTGQWIVPNTRVFASGVPTVGGASTGIALHPVTGTMGPMTAVQPDTRASGS
jgi:hypothetical protein